MVEAVGLLGGSFNPIHEGHLAMAEAAKKALGLDKIILMPAGNPPHKGEELAEKHHRLRMTELAAGDRFEVSAMEVERPGVTYTVDTLEALGALYPGAALWVIIGEDTLHEISTWHDARRVFSLCRFAVFARPPKPPPDVPSVAVTRLDVSIPTVSATAIRERIQKGFSLQGFVPEPVADYIGRHRLYHPPTLMDDDTMRRRLKSDLPGERFLHVLGVEETMRMLASRWGHDEERAALAGLLHDCAKSMSLKEMLYFMASVGEVTDQLRETSTALLHAPSGAAMARAVYGVTDPEILHAIRFHNTGCGNMGWMDKLLCIADMIEPGRHFTPKRQSIRERAMEDVDAALCGVLHAKIDRIRIRGKTLHPDTAIALKAIEQTIREGTA